MNSLHRHTPRTLGAMLAATAVAALLCQATPARAGVTFNGNDPAYTSLAHLSEYMSVGQFYGRGNDGKDYAASGVIISTGSTSWVLTAAHVVSGMNLLNFYYGDKGGDWSSFLPGSTRSNFVSATGWVAHPNWTGNLNSGYDIALVRFNQNLTTLCGALLCTVAQRYSGSGDTGLIGTAVGFGMTGTGLTGATIFDGLKRAGNSMIDAVAITPGKGGNRILLTDFDSGLASDNSYGSATPLTLEGMVAPGDSGGGLFIDINNTDFLVGITSFAWGRLDGNANSDFGDVAGFTRVSAFNSWIDSVIGGGGGGGGGGSPKPRGAALEVELGANLLASIVVAPIPEPASLALLGAGLFALSLLRRRR